MKRLVEVSPTDPSDKRVLATFRLVGDRVQVEQGQGVDGLFRFSQIYYKRLLTPADGRAYYDALDYAFGQSSFCYIETVPGE